MTARISDDDLRHGQMAALRRARSMFSKYSRSGVRMSDELLALIRNLVDKVDDLEGQVESLGLALKLDRAANTQAAFGIPENLAQLLIMLSDGMPHSRESVHGVLYFRRPEIDLPELRVVDSLVYQLRKSVKPHGVVIATIWGTSVQITSGLDLVRSAMETACIPRAYGFECRVTAKGSA
ncbi:hypothetical protein [Mesorhizobium sp. LNJC405B00]|uniref:hypothetical protein n=1 Tax=Mesorhizobium sp. LNJC405B00 TaxID=1287281 RepID=UPI0004CF7E30|nr:hypothetical protein [Mesorhizobium sp. LNJC405B00]